ncbi:DUF917 domain-containing protein [Alicyclobacillus sp. SO9]|uniref:DUF917 domain-containing protein n=1 Tax=Alicyclobacillus sp. SO9 TaxID=2665646 RepID=UPI0018E8DF5C|nr:DUF917 domain-containing protein [Alicyclobacillus sp. SO9]QQE80475.1 DUF917 domain-containing protein [Alicyclobacillus sp. SO9]
MRELTEENLRNIAMGAAVLGTGGGGNAHMGLLTALQVMKQGYKFELTEPEELEEDLVAVAMFGIGAPTVGVEKIRNGSESIRAMKTLERYLGKKFQAIAPIEVGGVNSMLPLALGAMTGLPVMNLDGMGRAFPEVQMVTYSVYGIEASPMAVADERGNVNLIDAYSDVWTERIARATCVVEGGHADALGYVSTVGEFIRTSVPSTYTLAERIGNVIRYSRDVWNEVLDTVDGHILFEGKCSDIERKMVAGFARGSASIEGMGPYKGSEMTISFQNENLVALLDGKPVATVPDLITVMDYENAKPLTTEVLRYGVRVKVLAIPCHEKWRTPEALRVAGPKAFGYDFEYISCERIRAENGALL